MNDRASSFLVGVLGEPGARAFKKAMEAEGTLAGAVVPRAIVSWLDLATKFSYSGNIPGLENTFVEFRKSDKGYDGAISIGTDIYNFTNASPYHLAASVAVALGVDDTGITTQTRDATLQRLGKSIDALVKSQVVGAALEKRKLQKTVPPGPEIRQKTGQSVRVHNYDHVLSPEHKQAGYQIHVHHTPKLGAMQASLTHRDPVLGLTEVGHIKASHDGQNITVADADMHPDHMGKGLGSAMYEAVMAHGFHSGARQVVGDVHDALSKKMLDPNAGYQLSHEHQSVGNGQMITKVNVHSPAGEHVGAATFMHHPSGLRLSTVVVDDAHQRMGIGSAMLSHAQKMTGKPLVDSTQQTPEGAALWQARPLAQTELPGSANKPTAQQEALKPEAPSFQTAQPRPMKGQTARISKSEAGHKCPTCRRVQMQGDQFVGCFCFRDLAKAVSILKADAGGYTVRFDAEWDADAIRALRESMRE